MKSTTSLLHNRISNDFVNPSVTPIYQCSAFSADSSYFYSRKDNPNVAELEMVVAELEEAEFATAVTCGMSAIYILFDLLTSGSSIVLNKLVYGCSYKLFQKVAKRRRFRLFITDLSDATNYQNIPEDTKMVFLETPTNPFLRTISISDLSTRIKSKCPNALVVVDNTWATPLYQKPLNHGADISLHSGTKYFSGHSDVMNGVILTNDEYLHEKIREIRFYGGAILSPENAWLVRRSLQTLTIRVQKQSETTLEMVDFLSHLSQVQKVYYPEIDGKQLTGYGGILFFSLQTNLSDKYMEFVKELKIFGTGTGMACVT